MGDIDFDNMFMGHGERFEQQHNNWYGRDKYDENFS